jgi:hypothetical protein
MPSGPASKRVRGGWILELLVLFGLWSTYDRLRDVVRGDGLGALRHARTIVGWERALGIYHERRIQQWFIDRDWFVSLWNVYYGTIHFVGPIAALVWLYRTDPGRYVRWRNTLVVMLGLAVLCFWAFPLTPPRLMPERYGFVDTGAEFFTFGPQERVLLDATGNPVRSAVDAYGNLFAAMPSLHVGWSTWTALAVLPTIRRRWIRAAVALYPLATLFAITVTGNHWVLDAVGGWLVLAAAWGIAVAIERARAPFSLRPDGGGGEIRPRPATGSPA